VLPRPRLFHWRAAARDPGSGDLARDEVWFVRLRAVIAVGEIRHPRTIPVCSKLCAILTASFEWAHLHAGPVRTSSNRNSSDIVDSRDRYALHALISASNSAGGFEQTLKELSDALLRDEMLSVWSPPSAKAQPACGRASG